VSRALVIRLFPALLVIVLAGLLLAVDSIASPGGGGGGGGGGFHGGGSSGGGFSIWSLLVVGGFVLLVVVGLVQAARLRKRRRERAARVELASAEAAADDPYFAADRVVVRLEAVLRDVVIDRDGEVIERNEEDDEITTLAEYWTLARAADGWRLHSIEQDDEGAHHLDAPIVASPWSDEARLHDAAVTELALADAVPDAAIAEIVDVDYAGDARTQALDLAVVDGRFAPAVLEAAARRAVEAWAEAVDGADAALERAATPEAAHALLYPQGTNTRLVVRGPRLTALRIAALDAQAQSPAMVVEAELRGRRYLEDRDTAAVLDGSKDREASFTERWTLALGADAETPWRIVATTAVG
jgi:hypothetical protein